MRRTLLLLAALLLLTHGPVCGQEKGEAEAVGKLLRLMADARSGAGWVVALEPHPVEKLDSLLRRYGLDLRDPGPHGRSVRVTIQQRRQILKPAGDKNRLSLRDAVNMMERDIKRWILRSGSGLGGVHSHRGGLSFGGDNAPPRAAGAVPRSSPMTGGWRR